MPEKKMNIKKAIAISLRGYKILWQSPMMLLSGGLHAAAEALSPFIGIYMLAQIINELATDRNLDRLIRLTIITLIATAVASLLTAGLLRLKNYHRSTQYFERQKLFTDKLFKMDFRDVDSSHTHGLLSQIRQNDNWGGWGFWRLISSFDAVIKAILSIAGAIALTVSLFTSQVPQGVGWLTVLNHPLFILLIIVVMITVSVISPLLAVKGQLYFVSIADTMKLGNRIFEFWARLAYDTKRTLDMRMYRQDVFSQDHLAVSLFGTDEKDLIHVIRPVTIKMSTFSSLSAMVGHVLTAVVYIFICLKAWGGAFAVGSITQYIRSITAMAAGFSSLVMALGALYNNASFLQTVFEYLDIENTMYQGSLSTEKRSDNKYSVEFKNVSFKYPGREEYALRNVSLNFEVGQRLAVVGENGSGKTTFIKLLCRLYDPTEGEILLNGIDIRKYDYRQYMDIFAVVFQDFKLLAFELGQNVAASAEYDSKKVSESLAKVGLEEKWDLETTLYKDFKEDGVEVSGGEAQKIALARILYKNAPFIILDEPTAALDPLAEFEVYSKMNEIIGKKGEKTSVFISHRLSSCRFCDNIAVFDKGRVVQKGGHDELVADLKGKYYELWDAQAEYYTG